MENKRFEFQWFVMYLYLVRENDKSWHLYYREVYDANYVSKMGLDQDGPYYTYETTYFVNDKKVKGLLRNFTNSFNMAITLDSKDLTNILTTLSYPAVQEKLELAYQTKLKKEQEIQKIKDKYSDFHKQEKQELKDVEQKYSDTTIDL